MDFDFIPAQEFLEGKLREKGDSMRSRKAAQPASKMGQPVRHYEIVHEKLFHMFIVRDDLGYFLHDHPIPQADGSFLFDITFAKPGMYRVVGDFYPTGGTPQLIARTLIVPGPRRSGTSAGSS